MPVHRNKEGRCCVGRFKSVQNSIASIDTAPLRWIGNPVQAMEMDEKVFGNKLNSFKKHLYFV